MKKPECFLVNPNQKIVQQVPVEVSKDQPNGGLARAGSTGRTEIDNARLSSPLNGLDGRRSGCCWARENMKKIIIVLLLVTMQASCSLPEAHKVSPQFAGGIGALMREHDGIEIVKVAQGLPADNAGMKAWDKILEIDGMPTLGLRLPEAILLLRGPAGSKTTLLVRSIGRSEPQAVILIRKAIDPETLKWKNEVMMTTENGQRYVEEAGPSNKSLKARRPSTSK
jgi:hypothetical protein